MSKRLAWAEVNRSSQVLIRKGPGGDEVGRLGKHLQLVTEGDAHSFGSMINCQDAHEGNFTSKPSKEKYDSQDTHSRLQCFHNSGGRVDHFLNVRWAVGGRDEPRLKLRGGQVDSFGQHGVEVFCESCAVALHRFSQVMHGLTGEVGAEHGTAAVELQRVSR